MVIPAGAPEQNPQLKPTTAATTAEYHDMAVAAERSKRLGLHNFSTLPSFNLRWGRQRQLRCVKPFSPSPHLNNDGGIEAAREKLLLAAEEGDAAGGSRPWNLRTRRAVCRDPTGNNASTSGGGGGGDRRGRTGSSPVKTAEVKSPLRRGGCDRIKFSGCLSKQEIEEDVFAILGTKPARRPKKRPRCVQKQIDCLYPAFWLSEVTVDMYKVYEHADAGKR